MFRWRSAVTAQGLELSLAGRARCELKPGCRAFPAHLANRPAAPAGNRFSFLISYTLGDSGSSTSSNRSRRARGCGLVIGPRLTLPSRSSEGTGRGKAISSRGERTAKIADLDRKHGSPRFLSMPRIRIRDAKTRPMRAPSRRWSSPVAGFRGNKRRALLHACVTQARDLPIKPIPG